MNVSDRIDCKLALPVNGDYFLYDFDNSPLKFKKPGISTELSFVPTIPVLTSLT